LNFEALSFTLRPAPTEKPHLQSYFFEDVGGIFKNIVCGYVRQLENKMMVCEHCRLLLPQPRFNIGVYAVTFL
jgi:hypothetical protein